MNKIKELLNKLSSIPNDKLLHFFYGTLIALAVSCFTSLGLPEYYIILTTLTVAILKEVYDKFYGSKIFDLKDIVYTIAPSVMIYLLLILR